MKVQRRVRQNDRVGDCGLQAEGNRSTVRRLIFARSVKSL